MNNNQFRRLVLDTPARQSSSDSKSKNGASNPAATPSLGSRARSSIPMTPRSIAGYSSRNEFARQLAAQNNPTATTQKKFRSTAAPKGAKLAAGYTDRTKGREDEAEESDKVKRIRALEEMMKLDQIDEPTFIKLREEILGDSVGGERAGLVKGLDWGLLERARKGEVGVMDVLEGQDRKLGEEERDEGEDVDVEFDELEERDVEAIVREKVVKKGEMAPPSLTGKKRNRDQILAELKAARLAAKEAAAPSLGSKFKKVGEKRSTSRIEKDSRGREVLITIDENGVEKRKVRKAPIEPQVKKDHGLLMPDKDAVPLGMVVPDIPKSLEADIEDIGIFDDVGDDYDPLAGLEEESSEEEKEDGEVEEKQPKPPSATEQKGREKEPGSMPPPPPPQRRNYFNDPNPSASSIEPKKPAGLTDPTLLAALKKASTLNPITSKTPADEEEAAKAEKRRKMLQQDDRDAEDMDMGFGSSRFEDQDDGEEGGDGKRIKLSEWGADDDGEEDGKGGKGKRKRGPKKRKGDGNSAKDVLAAMERRKGEK